MQLDNITLDPANKMNDQTLHDFKAGIGAAAHATLDTEQLISHTRTVLVHKIASLQGSDGGVTAASEVHELLTKIHNILDSAVSKHFGNKAPLLAYLLILLMGSVMELGFPVSFSSKYSGFCSF